MSSASSSRGQPAGQPSCQPGFRHLTGADYGGIPDAQNRVPGDGGRLCCVFFKFLAFCILAINSCTVLHIKWVKGGGEVGCSEN